MPPNVRAAPSGALYTGRGPVCGIIIRFAGANGEAAPSSAATDELAAGDSGCVGADDITAGVSFDTSDGDACVGITTADLATTGALAVSAGLSIFDSVFLAAAMEAADGFAITGPDGGREAIAGVEGEVTTIGGACLGCGTTLRGDPVACAVEDEAAEAAVVGFAAVTVDALDFSGTAVAAGAGR